METRPIPTTPPDDWRYFDNGGRTMDRYSIWQGGSDWLDCSEFPFHPQGVGMHGEGLPPEALFARDDDDWTPEMEIEFSDLPPDVQRAVLQDAAYYVDEDGDE
jgi:hypothetical protein